MASYKVKADETLFNLYVSLSHGVRNLSAIVKNDLELTSEQYVEWMNHASDTQLMLKNLISDTISHVGDAHKDEKK